MEGEKPTSMPVVITTSEKKRPKNEKHQTKKKSKTKKSKTKKSKETKDKNAPALHVALNCLPNGEPRVPLCWHLPIIEGDTHEDVMKYIKLISKSILYPEITKYLGFSDLSNLRLVCKDMRTYVAPAWKQKIRFESLENINNAYEKLSIKRPNIHRVWLRPESVLYKDFAEYLLPEMKEFCVDPNESLFKASNTVYIEIINKLLERVPGMVHLYVQWGSNIDEDVINLCLKHKDRIKLIPAGNIPLIYRAAYQGYSDQLHELIKDENVNDRKGSNYTILTILCQKGSLSDVKKLVSAGANIDLPTRITQRTPLIAATIAGQTDVVKYLLELNANVYIRDCTGFTCMDYAIVTKNTELQNIFSKYFAPKAIDDLMN